ncbi:MAG: 2-iminoacetate synthase ThiH [Calditrichia bacterium]
MGFADKIDEVFKHYRRLAREDFSATDWASLIQKEKLTVRDFWLLLQPAALPYLELMAQKANRLTRQYFGQAVQIYAPLYLSNYCTNRCIYCGYNAGNRIRRRTLTSAEIEEEIEALYRKGFRHVLLLTGEASREVPVEYLKTAAQIALTRMSQVSIEVYPMAEADYRELYRAGVSGITLYQECYDREIYAGVHLKGPKTNYTFRLNAPERATRAGFRLVNIGPLLGLANPPIEVFAAGLHLHYLETRYPGLELSVSLPRIRPAHGAYQPQFPVTDAELTQYLLALRLFMPRVGINLSTRESAALRDNLLPLGITRLSAESKTTVGGYAAAAEESVGQFEVSDNRSMEQILETLRRKNYQPLLKDWETVW